MDYRALYFNHLETDVYLNHAAISPLNARALTAMQDLAAHYARKGVNAWTAGNAARDQLRQRLGAMIGCGAEQIGLISNTSHGINLIAHEFPWRSGDRLVLVRDEFPTNILPWTTVAAQRGLDVVWLDLDDVLQESQAFTQAMERQPRLFAVSWVQYQTGCALDLEWLANLRTRYGVRVCVDGIQGLGPLCADMQQHPVDYLVCGGHKWLLGPEGAGFLYVHPDAMAELEPRIVGWLSQEDPVSFLFEGAGHVDYEKPMQASPHRYEMGTMNQIGFAALNQSIGIFLEVGPEEVARRIQHNANRIRSGLKDLGITPADGGRGAGIVSFPLGAGRLKAVTKTLAERDISVATPDGYLRAAPHFYNTDAEIDRYLSALADVL